jgi:hypothetical protein
VLKLAVRIATAALIVAAALPISAGHTGVGRPAARPLADPGWGKTAPADPTSDSTASPAAAPVTPVTHGAQIDELGWG